MTHSLPNIRIKDAWLLRQNTSVYLNELWGGGEPLRSDEEYANVVTAYKMAWQPFEKKILTGLTKTLDLSFNQNIIDVYIAPWFSAFSDPMVIGVVAEPDVFIDHLTHELIHRLLTDNKMVNPEVFLVPEWEKLYGKSHSFNTLIHIPVHAVHKEIYVSVLQDEARLRRDIDNCVKNNDEDYVKSWDYVNSHDHIELINKIKESYTSYDR